MALSTLVHIRRVRNMALADITGQISQLLREIGLATKLRAMALTNGLMADSMWVTGKKITCMVKEFTVGLMAGSMKEAIQWTRIIAMESITGLMAGYTKDTGEMENSMVKESIHLLKESNREVCGKMAKDSSGQMMMTTKNSLMRIERLHCVRIILINILIK